MKYKILEDSDAHTRPTNYKTKETNKEGQLEYQALCVPFLENTIAKTNRKTRRSEAI